MNRYAPRRPRAVFALMATALAVLNFAMLVALPATIETSTDEATLASSEEPHVDSGIRAVHASGPPGAGEWAHQWPNDLERLQKKYFSSADQLVTLRMFSGPSQLVA